MPATTEKFIFVTACVKNEAGMLTDAASIWAQSSYTHDPSIHSLLQPFKHYAVRSKLFKAYLVDQSENGREEFVKRALPGLSPKDISAFVVTLWYFLVSDEFETYQLFVKNCPIVRQDKLQPTTDYKLFIPILVNTQDILLIHCLAKISSIIYNENHKTITVESWLKPFMSFILQSNAYREYTSTNLGNNTFMEDIFQNFPIEVGVDEKIIASNIIKQTLSFYL